MKLSTQDPTKPFDWPGDWPQPTRGANASPMLDDAAFAAFKADIEKNELNDKIHFTKGGKIAKGRNRYRALRELGKSHDEIVTMYGKIAPTDDESDMLSNTLRVHRSRTSSLASFFIVFPGQLRDLVSDRKRQQKTGAGGPKRSGLASEIAAKLGCSPAVVTRFVDYLATLSQEQRAQEVERAAMDESFSIPVEVEAPEVETPETEDERSELQAQLRTTNEKRDRRKLPQETEQAIVKSLDSSASISETARELEVSKSVVHKLKKEGAKPKPESKTSKPQPKSDEDRINEWTGRRGNEWIEKAWIEKMWKRFGPSLSDKWWVFEEFIIAALEAPVPASIIKDALEALRPNSTTTQNEERAERLEKLNVDINKRILGGDK